MNNVDTKIICLAGMGRSGTSLMASYLQYCGVAMGDRVLDAGKWNRKGFFEDKEFLEYHKTLLKINKSNLYVPRSNLVVPDSERQKARDMIVRRSQQAMLWGWKDPRTSLFLDMWTEINDDIRFIFMYRNPYEVIESIFRTMMKPYLYARPWLAPAGWLFYNKQLIDFQDRYPERCAFVSIHGFDSDPGNAQKVLGEWLGIQLEKPYRDLYDPSDRRSGTSMARPFPINVWMPLVSKIYRDRLAKLFREVEARALIASGLVL